MAYVKISQIKSESYLKQAIAYILNPKKTEELLNTASYMCSAEYAPTEFRDVRMQAIKKGNNIAHEIYQSFSPEDNIDPLPSTNDRSRTYEKSLPKLSVCYRYT